MVLQLVLVVSGSGERKSLGEFSNLQEANELLEELESGFEDWDMETDHPIFSFWEGCDVIAEYNGEQLLNTSDGTWEVL